ncbi:MAG: phosphate signaling complex protein PhoU [Nitrospirota bacterium]|nr:phosphate signaling complex protein PhoU [Nitrospirota bacterium]
MAPNQAHTSRKFDEEMSDLKSRVLSLGGLVEKAIDSAMMALLNTDNEMAELTIDRDKAINALEVQCDDMTRSILVRRQPAAGDLRFIISAIKVVTDLERMGDLAAGIAEGSLRLGEMPDGPKSSLSAMSDLVKQQVSRALDALSRGDIDLAMEVIEKDNAVDEMYHATYRELLTYMIENPRRISAYIILSNIAKNLERIGDHATNLCEMVIYIIRAHDIRHVDHEAAAALLKEE